MTRSIIALAALVTGAAAAAPAAPAAGLGLTAARIEEADLIDGKGRDIGDVEHVVLDARGRATALIVEVDRPDPQPDKLVRIGLARLRAVPDKEDVGEHDIMVTTPVARLPALPDWRPR